MTDPNPDDHLPVESAGHVAGVPPRTLRHWVKGGKLPAIEGPRGKLVRLGDVLALAETTGRSAATARQANGNAGNPARSAGGNAGNAASEPAAAAVSVSPAAVAQLEAIRDQWLRPLVERNEDLARQVGRLEAERDALRADLERLGDAPRSAPAPPREAEPPKPSADALALRWRRWWRRMTGG